MIDFLIKYKIKKYDVISLDVFDTIIERDCENHTDVFFRTALNIFDKKTAEQYRLDRIEAEKKATIRFSPNEIRLDDIYSCLPDKYGAYKDELKELEIFEELCAVSVKKSIIPIIEFALLNKKKIYLISDMYLSKKVIERMIDKCFPNFTYKLFVSSEVGKNKVTSELFNYVIKTEQIENSSILHIGDSLRADILGAKRIGIACIWIPKNNLVSRMVKKIWIKFFK